MRHIYLLRGMAFLVLVFMLIPMNNINAQQPEYAQWGKIAVEEVSKEFPDLDLVNYNYQGTVYISEERFQYNFEFTLESNEGEQKMVQAYVLVNPTTEKLIDVYFDEIEDLN